MNRSRFHSGSTARGLRGALITITCLLAFVAVSGAQVAKPTDRSKDNKHKSTADQHKRIELLSSAWTRCLAIHIPEFDETVMRARIDGVLQNQYSEFAAYFFWPVVEDAVLDDIEVPKVYRTKQALRRGGVLSAYVNDVVRRAVGSSRGILGYAETLGDGKSLRVIHDKVLKDDDETMRKLESLLVEPRGDLQSGVKELARVYSRCLGAGLTMGGSSKQTAFKNLIEEQLGNPVTADAIAGVKTKLREAVRSEVLKNRTNRSAEDHLKNQVDVQAYIDENVDAGFWSRLEDHHRELHKDPTGYLPLLKDAECALR